MIELAAERFGGVDILFNNLRHLQANPFLDHSEADFDRFLNTILKGKFFMRRRPPRP